MTISGKAVERTACVLIYAGLAVLTIWAGTGLINYSLDSRFYRDFVMKWEVALQAYEVKGGAWPYFSGGNHVSYMDQLTRMMQERALHPPKSNTGRAYIYRLDKIGLPEENIFILCFSQSIVLYGISPGTALRLDEYIDGKADTGKGLFTYRLSKDSYTYIGRLQI